MTDTGGILAMGSNANTNIDKLITFGQMTLEQGWYNQAREDFEQALPRYWCALRPQVVFSQRSTTYDAQRLSRTI